MEFLATVVSSRRQSHYRTGIEVNAFGQADHDDRVDNGISVTPSPTALTGGDEMNLVVRMERGGRVAILISHNGREVAKARVIPLDVGVVDCG